MRVSLGPGVGGAGGRGGGSPAGASWLGFLLPVEVVSSSLPDLYVEKVLEFLASSLEVSHHLEFYLVWAQKLLMAHGQKLKARCAGVPCAGAAALGADAAPGWPLGGRPR